MKIKLTTWFCPRCDLTIESPTIEQAERTRYDHVRNHHPDYLHLVEGQPLAPVHMIESHVDWDARQGSVVCLLCHEREEMSLAPFYPNPDDAETAVDAMVDVFSRTHADRHRETLIASEPARPENPFD